MAYLQMNTRSIKNFKDANGKKVELGKRLMKLSHILRDMMLHVPFDSYVENLLVQNVFRHFEESLIFAMRGEPTMCYSMIRIGVEGCRDLLRILEKPSLSELYIEGPSSKENRKLWRKEFRFDEENEKFLFGLYNICSDFGVHARFPLSDAVGEIASLGSKDFVILGQKKQSQEAFILGLHAIEISNVRIMATVSPLIDSFPEPARKFSLVWKQEYDETSKLTQSYFDAYRARKREAYQ